MEESFHKGEIVWAKVEGFPRWPGEIKRILHFHKKNESQFQKKIYQINFIGHSSYVYLPVSKIDKFEDKFEKYSKTKKQNLINAIQKAKKMNEMNKTVISVQSEDEDSISSSSFLSSNNEKTENDNNYLSRKVKYNTNNQEIKIKKDKGINTINSDSNIYGNPKNIKINIKINVTNNNNNTVISTFNSNFEEKEKKRENYNKENNNIFFSNYKFNNNDNINLDDNKIKNIMNNLLKYQIEIPNNHIHKSILSELNNLYEEFKAIKNKNIYYLIKDIIPVLNSLSYNKYGDIVDKSNDILSCLIQRLIEELFQLDNTELDQLEEKLTNIDIDNLHNEIKKIFLSPEKKKSLRNNPSKNIFNQINEENIIKTEVNKNINFINDTFLKLINEDDLKAKNELNSLIKDFYDNIYDKNNNLNEKTANKRKQICLKLFDFLKKMFPNFDEEDLKRMIIFIEYKIRSEDPKLGEKYIKQIKTFFVKIKEKFNRIIK